MSPREMNILCQTCYYNDICAQTVEVKIIRCSNFKSTDIERYLFKPGKSKGKKRMVNNNQ